MTSFASGEAVVSIQNLSKVYAGGFEALSDINLDIRRGEIFALLGPNGAGKTTLIGTVCGLIRPTAGRITVGGHDVITDFRAARSMIGLVPQELTNERVETVWGAVTFTRGLFGKPRNDALVEKLLRDLSLWDKRDASLLALSGGMKRRVLIAKAMVHEPEVLFLDEPTAGVDVELRQDTWRLVHEMRERGTTVILTTHYIEEAEEMADRVGVITNGRILVVEDKATLMRTLGRKTLAITLQAPLDTIPPALADLGIAAGRDASELIYTYDSTAERTGMTRLVTALGEAGLAIKDLATSQSSLEDIFIKLVRDNA